MKRNLLLTSVLTILLIIVYFVYEKPAQDAVTTSTEKSLLNFSNLGPLLSFKNNKTEVYFHQGRYYIGDPKSNHLADKKSVDLFLNYLTNLHHKKVIDGGKREDYIPSQTNQLIFTFEKEQLVFTLGEKLQFSPEYYLELKRNDKSMVVLVEDKNIPDGVYQKDDAHNHDLNYRQILSLMSLDHQFFEDKKIFRLLDHFIVERVNITNFRGSSYSLNMETKETDPPRPSSLQFNNNAFHTLLNSIKKLKAKKIMSPFISSKLDQKLAEIKIEIKDHQPITLSLFNKYDGRAGYYLTNSSDNFLFEMQRADCEFLFKNVEHYWNLKFIEQPFNEITINQKTYEIKSPELIKATNLLKTRAMKWRKGNLKKENYKYLYQLKQGENVYKYYHRDQEVLITIDGDSGLLYYVGKDFPLSLGDMD